MAQDGPPLSAPYALTGLQEELFNAISSPLTPQTKIVPTQTVFHSPAVKTSETHPINITFLIPMEIIPLISSHLTQAAHLSSPTLFDVPLPLQLHRLILCSQSPCPAAEPPLIVSSYASQPPVPSQYPQHLGSVPLYNPSHPRLHDVPTKLPSAPLVIPRQPGIVNFLWNQKIVKTSKAVIATTASVGFKIPSLPSFPPTLSSCTSSSLPPPPLLHAQGVSQAAIRQDSKSNGRRLTTSLLSVSGSKRTTLSQTGPPDRSSESQQAQRPIVTTASVYTGIGEDPSPILKAKPYARSTPTPRSHEPCPSLQRSISDPLPILVDPLKSPASPNNTKPAIANSPIRSSLKQTRKPTLIGNLLLSSCPGKKVRLTGPINGRGGVCRDLRQDMQRFRDVGVDCVVCCLDDEELAFLGAPWDEYVKTAGEVGLDVLRIPIPEGLAPLSVNVLDEHLNKLIRTYTLNGVPILVHCRGGVGRAGLVACCWAIKLGLFGSIERSTELSTSIAPVESCLREEGTSKENQSPLPADFRDSVIQLVERVISSVRRRRSAKAVETYEQVCFLIEYVEYLHRRSRTEVQHDNADHALPRNNWREEPAGEARAAIPRRKEARYM
ncbi:hypothetical protein BC629DRAFT_1473021 [Irpex lacteus]|nr:hypothetical protein BC629DRAFT_1473021 [Irpex lacteus]